MTALTKATLLIAIPDTHIERGSKLVIVIFKNKNLLCSSSVVQFLLIKLPFIINASSAPITAFQKTGTYPFHLAGIWNPSVRWLPGPKVFAAASSPWRARRCPWETAASWTQSRLDGERRLGRRNLWPPSCPRQIWLLCHLAHEKHKTLVKLKDWKLAAEKKGKGEWKKESDPGVRCKVTLKAQSIFRRCWEPLNLKALLASDKTRPLTQHQPFGTKGTKKKSQDYLSEPCHTAEIFHLLLLHFHSSCSRDKFSILRCWELLERNR